MKIILRLAAPALVAALAACGSSEPAAGGLTAEEERALDNAAAMLDSNNIDVSADSLVANEEGDEADNTAGNAQ
jgi:hypothetical protein